MALTYSLWRGSSTLALLLDLLLPGLWRRRSPAGKPLQFRCGILLHSLCHVRAEIEVVVMVECPSRSWAILGCAPARSNCVAWLCRKSWKQPQPSPGLLSQEQRHALTIGGVADDGEGAHCRVLDLQPRRGRPRGVGASARLETMPSPPSSPTCWNIVTPSPAR